MRKARFPVVGGGHLAKSYRERVHAPELGTLVCCFRGPGRPEQRSSESSGKSSKEKTRSESAGLITWADGRSDDRPDLLRGQASVTPGGTFPWDPKTTLQPQSIEIKEKRHGERCWGQNLENFLACEPLRRTQIRLSPYLPHSAEQEAVCPR